MMNWNKLEENIAEPVPKCMKEILVASGFETLFSLRNITKDSLLEIENYMNDHGRKTIDGLKCKHSNYYQNQSVFKLLPGHRAFISNLSNHTSICGEREDLQITKNDFPLALRKMIETAEKNLFKTKYHNKYDDVIRFFATYVFLHCGRSCYELLCHNLPLPSIKTILRCVDMTKCRVIEGKLRCQELAAYLNDLKTVKRVWLAEDATMITSKVQYCSITDQLVGLTAPLDDKNGSPIPLSFPAINENMIREHLEKPRSRYAYLVMVQPLDDSVPPYVLQLFGTNNNFKSNDVIKRWESIRLELERNGIELVGVSSDGDPRLLSAMCYQMSNLADKNVLVVQDPTHIGTKLRNRLLKPNIVLPLGSHRINVGHLKTLVRTVQKSTHGLCMTDVCPIDRMNFTSFKKITETRVIESLEKNVQSSKATVKYLEICKEATSSFLQRDISPSERVFQIWHAVFFLRIWRQNILASRSFTLKDNFISSNSYMCIEINAQNLITMLKKFREENKPEQFLVSLFDSQMCENAFRQLRSMGTVEYTKINFSLYELLHMLGRLEVQNDIAYVKLADQAIHFPNKREGKSKIFPLPQDDELDAVLIRAKNQAIEDATEFGIFGPYDIDNFHIQSKSKINDLDMAYDDSDVEENDGENDPEYHEQICQSDSDDNNITGEKSALTTVMDEHGDEKTIRKSSLVWMLTEPSSALSKDRLKRFKTVTNKRKFNDL